MELVFEIINEKTSTYRLIRRLVIGLNLLGLIYLLVNAPKDFKTFMYPGIAIIACTVYLIVKLLEKVAKDPSRDTSHYLVLLFCANVWLQFDFYWLTIAIFLLMFFDFLATRKSVVKISEKKISMPSVLQKKISWEEVNNVLLKDRMLTIDQNNNRIFQQEVLHSGIDEEKFNSFCLKQIESAGKRVVI